MGSEMCIRDRDTNAVLLRTRLTAVHVVVARHQESSVEVEMEWRVGNVIEDNHRCALRISVSGSLAYPASNLTHAIGSHCDARHR